MFIYLWLENEPDDPGLDINFLRHLPCGQVPQGFHLPKQVFTGRPGK